MATEQDLQQRMAAVLLCVGDPDCYTQEASLTQTFVHSRICPAFYRSAFVLMGEKAVVALERGFTETQELRDYIKTVNLNVPEQFRQPQLDLSMVRLYEGLSQMRTAVEIADKAFDMDEAVKIPGTGNLNALQVVKKLNETANRIIALEAAIKTHRSQKADDRCIEDDDALYEALGDGIKCDRRVGDKAAMLRNCERFINNRCEAGGWPTYAEIEKALEAFLEPMRRYITHSTWLKGDEDLLTEAFNVARQLLDPTGKRYGKSRS